MYIYDYGHNAEITNLYIFKKKTSLPSRKIRQQLEKNCKFQLKICL